MNLLKTILHVPSLTGEVDGVKNRSGQWEGPGGGELNECIMHQVHTSVNKIINAQQHLNPIHFQVVNS